MHPRNARHAIEMALTDTPAVLVHGARQTGKTTLVKELAEALGGRYLSLDTAATRAAAETDPESFLAEQSTEECLVIDEAQRVPALMLAMKGVIDADRRPGRFLLTGSANILSVPKIAESLAGRMETVRLWPLARNEIAHHPAGVIDRLFATGAPPTTAPSMNEIDLWSSVLAGGFPEAVARRSADRREAWFDSYVASILDRDVRDLADVRDRGELDRLLRLLAARSASLLNYSNLATDVSMPVSTLKRYFALLEAVFLIQQVRAWVPRNLSQRAIKSPKIHLTDTGLAAALMGIDRDRLDRDEALRGALLETFVVTELIKHAAAHASRPRVFHYRTASRQEVDVILERRDGTVVGIEVKAGRKVDSRDVRALATLRDQLGERFVRGVVLYTGDASIPLGPKLAAWPVSALW